jgi:hypothetical protein
VLFIQLLLVLGFVQPTWFGNFSSWLVLISKGQQVVWNDFI